MSATVSWYNAGLSTDHNCGVGMLKDKSVIVLSVACIVTCLVSLATVLPLLSLRLHCTVTAAFLPPAFIIVTLVLPTATDGVTPAVENCTPHFAMCIGSLTTRY